MKKQLVAIAAGLSLAAAGLMGQGLGVGTGQGVGEGTQPMTFTFQQAGTMGATVPVQVYTSGGRGALVTGSPVSAREVNKTVQTLSDGTELENSSTTMFYRDSQGRTRTEPPNPNGTITILDPVAAVRITIDPSTKTAHRVNAPALANGGRGMTVTYTASAGDAPNIVLSQIQDLREGMITLQASGTPTATTPVSKQPRRTTEPKNQTTEDLGFQNQNGVLAQGTRTTLTIPQGQIGNNRDIHVVNERWYSKDLQMMVKSVNSDPRFGVTTYELTNISQNAPDPTLFLIPTGYTITDGPGRGARGGVVVGK